jgi:hypothetical protein
VETNALQDDQALRHTSVELIVPGGDLDIVPGVIRPGIEQLAVEVSGASQDEIGNLSKGLISRHAAGRCTPDTHLPLAGRAVSPEPAVMPRDNLDWFADDRRMSVRPPLRSRPVQNVETITSLIVVAARLLDVDVRGGVFTLEQLLKKMRELLRPGRTLAADDVRAVLPGMGHCLATVGGRWRWKRREPAYLG